MSEFWVTVGLAALSWGVAIYLHFRAFVRGAREDAKARADEIAAESVEVDRRVRGVPGAKLYNKSLSGKL